MTLPPDQLDRCVVLVTEVERRFVHLRADLTDSFHSADERRRATEVADLIGEIGGILRAAAERDADAS